MYATEQIKKKYAKQALQAYTENGIITVGSNTKTLNP